MGRRRIVTLSHINMFPKGCFVELALLLILDSVVEMVYIEGLINMHTCIKIPLCFLHSE